MPELPYPGTPAHQALLSAIVAYYANDPRIRAVALFGSLSRGNWDALSDLDLDIVIADGLRLDAVAELGRLSAAVSPAAGAEALVVADGPEAGDVVLADLMQFSVRYHPLATTKAAIVDSLWVLATTIDPAVILAAGRANPPAPPAPAAQLINQCVRYIVGTEVALQRRQRWAAVDLLHRVRGLVMDLFALSHGGGRALPTFQAQAPADLQARLGQTLPPYDSAGLRAALAHSMAILEDDLELLTAGAQRLSPTHRQLLARVRARQATLGGQLNW